MRGWTESTGEIKLPSDPENGLEVGAWQNVRPPLWKPLPRSRLPHERRYNDQEVAQIIERASTSQEAERGGTLPTGDGLTLAALTEIAAEVGIHADLIARAATV